ARHQHDASAELLNGGTLLLVGTDDVVETCAAVKLIGARTAASQRAGNITRRIERAADQFERGLPIEPHPALRSVHRLGDAEAERPQMPAEGDGALPVDRGLEPRIGIRER